MNFLLYRFYFDEISVIGNARLLFNNDISKGPIDVYIKVSYFTFNRVLHYVMEYL